MELNRLVVRLYVVVPNTIGLNKNSVGRITKLTAAAAAAAAAAGAGVTASFVCWTSRVLSVLLQKMIFSKSRIWCSSSTST